MAPDDLRRLIKRLATEAGFDRCGIARAGPIGRADYLRAWLAAGRAGSMRYLERHLDKRTDPRNLLDGAQSVIVVAKLYNAASGQEPPEASQERGRVSKYAWGDDYHDVVKEKLHGVVARLQSELSDSVRFRVCVDTAPLLERELGAAAGIGWIGKNTMVLDTRLGSYFFLGTIITTIELPADEQLPSRCGTCTACLEACPTGALPRAYEMDASRCISYLTIEHRGDIPEELQPLIGDWVFGCDVCQEVCPYNRSAPVTREPRFGVRPPGPRPLLRDLLDWSTEEYRGQVHGSAMERARLDMLKRNARIAMANVQRRDT